MSHPTNTECYTINSTILSIQSQFCFASSHVAIPYTVHVVGVAPPAGNPAPFLQLILCGCKGQSQPIGLKHLGSIKLSSSSETYSVEGSDVGDLLSIGVHLVGMSTTPWLIHKIAIHNPGSGLIHHFMCGHGVVCGESECVLEVMDDVLGSSVDTSMTVSVPASDSSANLVGEWVCLYLTALHSPFTLSPSFSFYSQSSYHPSFFPPPFVFITHHSSCVKLLDKVIIVFSIGSYMLSDQKNCRIFYFYLNQRFYVTIKKYIPGMSLRNLAAANMAKKSHPIWAG